MKILLAALVGGLFVFVWSAVSHIAVPAWLGIGELATAPDLASEDALLAAMQKGLPRADVYLLPGAGYDSKNPAEVEAFEQRQARGPFAFLVYQPEGKAVNFPKSLAIEFASNVLAALIAASILATTSCAYATRVAIVFSLGIFAWLSLESSYWNFYRFPDDYVLFELIDQGGGWFFGGLMISAMVKGKASG